MKTKPDEFLIALDLIINAINANISDKDIENHPGVSRGKDQNKKAARVRKHLDRLLDTLERMSIPN